MLQIPASFQVRQAAKRRSKRICGNEVGWLDRLFLSQDRAAAVGSAFCFHPRNDRQPENHHFWSLIMLAVTAGAFLLATWVATKALFFFLKSHLKTDWQRHVLASSGYLELGIIAPAGPGAAPYKRGPAASQYEHWCS